MELPETDLFPVESVLQILPTELKQLIYIKLLRSTLDDIDYEEYFLLSSTELNLFERLYKKRQYSSRNNIDYYIRLLLMRPPGTNPNILSYKGNTIIHSLSRNIINLYQKLPFDNPNYLCARRKFDLLCKYGININVKSDNGNTIAHGLIRAFVTFSLLIADPFIEDLIIFLIKLGMDIRSITNNSGKSAHQMGRDGIKNYANAHRLNISLSKFFLESTNRELSMIKNKIT